MEHGKDLILFALGFFLKARKIVCLQNKIPKTCRPLGGGVRAFPGGGIMMCLRFIIGIDLYFHNLEKKNLNFNWNLWIQPPNRFWGIVKCFVYVKISKDNFSLWANFFKKFLSSSLRLLKYKETLGMATPAGCWMHFRSRYSTKIHENSYAYALIGFIESGI